VAEDLDAILRVPIPPTFPISGLPKFELSINLKAARRLGLSVPAILLASADKVIE